ncbi:LacI family DNA-binding transcriptional regulator [Amycolatopsis sp. H20-H5]|uniref:LacI family DNA-binding transcriptional regulator n=1 Tax=Amycolatopsis sp. H20-H5 TaxID=3046309 RepID=UPI002DBBB5BC|nr:substrate-binding domain-containing protein [Amycolatopsis sp. H20-H5]MEC3975653.1 substrate-binding domain-containing protein [Amycolatopsis sp. H20-H5]
MTALSPELPLWDTPVTHRFGVAMAMRANPYAGELLRAIDLTAAQSGCVITLADTGDSVSEEAAVIRALRADRVDGVLLVPSAGDEAVINGLVRMGVPTVLVDRISERTDVDQVGSENIQSVCTLVRHLAERRHRNIGLISGEPGLTTSEERVLGYRLGLGRAGLRWKSELVACGLSTPGGAAAAAGRLLDGWPSPTALVVTSEAMLIGVQYEAHRRGIRIGTELAVVGYGDMDWARRVEPAVTTMAQPITEIGRKAVQLLLSRIADPDRRPEAVRLAPRFRHRASCGC